MRNFKTEPGHFSDVFEPRRERYGMDCKDATSIHDELKPVGTLLAGALNNTGHHGTRAQVSLALRTKAYRVRSSDFPLKLLPSWYIL